MVTIGSGAKRQVADVRLSRYTCENLREGYKGLYAGRSAKDIHASKEARKSQKILDHMGSTERAVNLFRPRGCPPAAMPSRSRQRPVRFVRRDLAKPEQRTDHDRGAEKVQQGSSPANA